MRAFGRHNSMRCGVTLMELLIVISIMMLLAAVAIPTMRPALEGRRVREAARAVHVFFGSARYRAIETGRPCGVILQRFEGQPECAMVLHQAEVPPPYGGDTLDAKARLQITTISGNVVTLTAAMEPAGSFTSTIVNQGDQVQFNHQGPFYKIVKPYDDNHLTLEITLTPGQLLPWPKAYDNPPVPWSEALPYEIFRQPVASAATPLQLPATMVVDLEGSGTDSVNFQPAGPNDKSVTIMFSPNGALERVYYWYPDATAPDGFAYDAFPVTEPIFLLIGRREKIPVEAGEGANWQDLTNLWVTLNPQTGLVKVAEVALSPNFDPSDPVQRLAAFLTSRDFARQAQSKGGR